MKNCAINIIAVVMSGMLICVQIPSIGSIVDNGEQEVAATETTEDVTETEESATETVTQTESNTEPVTESVTENPVETETGSESVSVPPETETENPGQNQTGSEGMPSDDLLVDETETEEELEEEEDTEEEGIEPLADAETVVPFGGSGTVNDPYTIDSVESLKKLAEYVNNGSTDANGKEYSKAYYKLVDRQTSTFSNMKRIDKFVKSAGTARYKNHAEVPESAGQEDSADNSESAEQETPAETPESAGQETPAETPESAGQETPAETPESAGQEETSENEEPSNSEEYVEEENSSSDEESEDSQETVAISDSAEFNIQNNWTPIGNSGHNFQGVFDGNGKTINLTINSDSGLQGLFGQVSGATIKNLTLKGYVHSEGTNVGLIAGTSSYSTFVNCTLSGTVKGNVDNGTGTVGPFGSLYRDQKTNIINCDISGVESYPLNYTCDDHGFMAYKDTRNAGKNGIDVIACYNATWIPTTFYYVGYEYKSQLANANIEMSAVHCNGGRYIKVTYKVTNNSNAEITNGKLGTYADIQIGDNDYAKIEVIKEGGRAIGVKMIDTPGGNNHGTDCISKNAQYNLYFAGTAGVTDVSTYWFGHYNSRESNCFNQVSASSVQGTDSGLAFSWQGINLQPGESRNYSFILGVGEAADAPKWETYPVTLSAEQVGMKLDVTSKVSDAPGVTDTLYYHYAPEGSPDFTPETEIGSVVADGSVKTIEGSIDLSSLADGRYIFEFWLLNSKGVTTASVRKLVIIENGTISGDVEHFAERSVKVDDQTSENLFQVDENQLRDIVDNVITDEDIANNSNVQLTMTITDKTAIEPDREKAESVLPDITASTLGAYYDIILTKTTVTSGSPMDIELIHDTSTVVSGPGININLKIPEKMAGGSNYQIIRVHDGVAEPLETIQNGNMISFTSSKFSTYVLAYTPAQTSVSSGGAISVETPKPPADENNPKTGKKPGPVVKTEILEEDTEEPEDFENGEIIPVSNRTPLHRGPEPGTGESFPLEIYATILMIAGFGYLHLCFTDGSCGMTEETKKKLVARLVRWAKQGARFRRIFAVIALFFLLAYYHLIGKRLAKNSAPQGKADYMLETTNMLQNMGTKQEYISRLVCWTRQGSRIRKLPAVIALFFLLAYYYTVGRNVQMEVIGHTN